MTTRAESKKPSGAARASHSGLQIEVEARTLEDVRVALGLGVERILLDNMSLEMMAEAVQLTNGRAKLEASGNVTLETVRRIAETGVDFISVGALTHSAKVFDVSFDYMLTMSLRAERVLARSNLPASAWIVGPADYLIY